MTSENAGNLTSLAGESQTLVCIDPPYYDNVMYAELADYFYVWHKRTLGRLWPDLFEDQLTNKHDEAVTNKARFSHADRRAATLANHDYTAKMAAIFAECHRVLAPDGVMTLMFTPQAGRCVGLARHCAASGRIRDPSVLAGTHRE